MDLNYETIRVRWQGTVCFLQLHRPEVNNTINAQLIAECSEVLAQCERSATIVVMEGLPEVFCMGADFEDIRRAKKGGDWSSQDPGLLYNLWLKMVTGPYVTIAHVRGKANAGGIGFVAACDIVLASDDAQFSLSELLFGLMPACVLPFLIRRTGFQKAHYLTLMTQPISSVQASACGLVDAHEARSDELLRRHLLRLRRLSKTAIARYKDYMTQLNPAPELTRPIALAANRKVFSDPQNLEVIARYIETGEFPWENTNANTARS